jgi:hypothetical protein
MPAQTSTRAASTRAASTRAASAPAPVDDDPDPALLNLLGEMNGEHVLLVGNNVLELMCALIRRGAGEVTLLRPAVRPEPQTVDLAIMAQVGSLDGAVTAIGHARRALTATGRVVLGIGADPSGRLAQGLRRMLRLHGFSAIRAVPLADRTLLSAELPLFGSLAHH